MAKLLDLRGKKFGNLTVKELTEEKDKRGYRIWECICDCGKNCKFSSAQLLREKNKYCGYGCFTKINNLKGKRFGRLLVKELHPERSNQFRARWICKCDCGNNITVVGKYLSIGHTRSCGCLKIDLSKERCGEKSSNWKGGKDIKGSEAWANVKISSMRSSSKRYGYTGPSINTKAEEVIRLFLESNKKCNICKKDVDSDGSRMCVDHDHLTGKIRGVLCSKCNIGLGSFEDSIEVLEKAIKYLKETKPQSTDVEIYDEEVTKEFINN